MPRFRKILVPIEGDPYFQPVLARAVKLAAKHGGTIKLITVVEPLPWYTRLAVPRADELSERVVEQKRQGLRKLAEELQREEVQAEFEVLAGRRYLELAREATSGGFDLLMKEAESSPNMLLGSIDMYLLRSCPCPVWLFKPEHASRGFLKVMAAIDPTAPSDDSDSLNLVEELYAKDESLDLKILEFAQELATDEGSELHVVHAWSAPGEDLLQGEPMLAQDQIQSYVEDSRERASKAVNHLLGSCQTILASGQHVVHMLNGDPADVITSFAQSERIDLIVMGTVARTGVPGLMIGNTAESILQRVGCSVLAVKPDGFMPPVELD